MVKDNESEKKIYREYDSSVIHLISAWPKVLQILNKEIPDPEVIEIFPTNYCNFACPHCAFQDVHGDESEYLGLDTLERLLDELSKRDVPAIKLAGGGEPLVHPDIETIFDKLMEYGFRVGVETNGYKFVDSPQLVDRVVQCSDWVRFSIDGFTDETYKKVHGKGDIAYSALRERISELVAKAGDKPKIGLKMLISKLNYQDVHLATPEALKLGVDYLQFKFLAFPSHPVLGEEEIYAMTREIKKQINGINNQDLVVELGPAYKGENKSNQKCLMTFLHPVIDWDGEILICQYVNKIVYRTFEHRKKEHSLGNIHDGGFFKYWDSPSHWKVFNSIDHTTCVPNCPILRYNPIVNFIKSDNYKFRHI